MPTASDYDWLAARLDHGAERLEVLPPRFVLGLTPEVLTGPYADAVDGTIQVTARHVVASAAVLREAAALCRVRAERCREYTAAVDRYQREVVDPVVRRPPHTYPTRSPWMEYGA